MPVSVVKNDEEEHKWERAKQIAAEEGHEKDWKYIMGIYKRMNPRRFTKSASKASDMAKQISEVIPKDPLIGDIDPNAIRYKQISDAGLTGLLSTIGAGMGGRFMWRKGRTWLANALSSIKHDDPNDNSLLSRLGRFGESIKDETKGNAKRKFATNTAFAILGGLAGSAVSKKFIAPLALNAAEGMGSATSWKNVNDTYKSIFKDLPRKYQNQKLNELENYVNSAYGLNVGSNFLQKGINLGVGTLFAELAQKGLKGTPFAYNWDKKRSWYDNTLRQILPMVTDTAAISLGSGLSNLGIRRLTGQASPLPMSYYTPVANMGVNRGKKRIGTSRWIGRFVNDKILNNAIPGRELSHPYTAEIPVFTEGPNKGKPMDILSANQLNDATLANKKEFWNNTFGRIWNPANDILGNTIGKGVEKINTYADILADIPAEAVGIGNGKID